MIHQREHLTQRLVGCWCASAFLGFPTFVVGMVVAEGPTANRSGAEKRRAVGLMNVVDELTLDNRMLRDVMLWKNSEPV